MKKKECHIIPEEEKQCVWMTSGLISYKLCTRNYHCEDCIFDQVIRNEAGAEGSSRITKSAMNDKLFQDETVSFNNQTALFYHEKHCWVKVESTNDLWIGIDGILAKFIARVKAVALPNEGEEIKQGECFAHIIQEKHIMPLFSPLTGTVVFVNRGLEKEPEKLIHSFWDKGWLVRIKPDNLENDLRVLMFGKKAAEWYQQKENDVMESSRSMLNSSQSGIGATLQDGGEKLNNLADMLTSEQYCQILELLSGAEETL